MGNNDNYIVSNDKWKNLFKVCIGFLVVYYMMCFGGGGRFASTTNNGYKLSSTGSGDFSTTKLQGNYGQGNAYDRFYNRQSQNQQNSHYPSGGSSLYDNPYGSSSSGGGDSGHTTSSYSANYVNNGRYYKGGGGSRGRRNGYFYDNGDKRHGSSGRMYSMIYIAMFFF